MISSYFEQAFLVKPLPLLCTDENFKKNTFKQVFLLGFFFFFFFFNFPQYLLVQSVPKYLGHVATFQFTICYN